MGMGDTRAICPPDGYRSRVCGKSLGIINVLFLPNELGARHFGKFIH